MAPERKSLKTEAVQAKLRELILKPEFLDCLRQLNIDDMSGATDASACILRQVRSISRDTEVNMDLFINRGSTLVKGDSSKAAQVFAVLRTKYRTWRNCGRQQAGVASSRERRKLMQKLGITRPALELLPLLRQGARSYGYQTVSGHIQQVQLVERTRTKPYDIKLYTHTTEFPGCGDTAALVNTSTGYYTVDADKSVVFFSRSPDGEPEIELCILRDYTGHSKYSGPLFEWATHIVDDACRVRRNIRPTHTGNMVQIGLNMGPRHARVLGLAVSYTKALPDEEKTRQDRAVVGLTSVIWAALKAAAPAETTALVDKEMMTLDMPHLATRNVAAGKGYSVTIEGKEYTFANAERAPPEAYLSRGYVAWTHKDAAYCKYGFSICVSRSVTNCSHKTVKKGRKAAHCTGGGANFVDVGLKVLVKTSARSLLIFKPDERHGTTLAHGAVNRSITLAFSQRIADAMTELKNSGTEYLISSGAGAGEGNL